MRERERENRGRNPKKRDVEKENDIVCEWTNQPKMNKGERQERG